MTLGWKHDAVESDETVQMMGIHHTVHSFFIISLVHAVEDVNFQYVMNVVRKETESQYATASGS